MPTPEERAKAARERREAIEASIRNGTFGQTRSATPQPRKGAPKKPANPDPNMVPLGDGLADRARTALGNRARRMQEAESNDGGGSLSGARRPRSY